MTSLQTSLKSVFGGWTGAIVSNPQYLPKAWPLFKLATPQRAGHAPVELANIVASQIIPRLISAHPSAVLPTQLEQVAAERSSLTPVVTDAIDSFAQTLLAEPLQAAIGFAESLMAGGMTERAIYHDLLAPTARLLHAYWDDDRASYADITIGFGRLVRLIRDLELTTPYNGEDDLNAPSVLFAPRPGEEQTFGFYLIEESFRCSGWRASIETPATNQVLRASVHDQWFDMVCLSVTRNSELDSLSDTIEMIRGAARNPELTVIVSGSLFIERPNLIALVGADGTVSNGPETLNVLDTAKGRPAIKQ